MARAEFVENIKRRGTRRRAVEQLVDFALRVRIQHEELLELRAGVAQQFKAIFLRAGERLLVTVDHARRIWLEFAEPDEALACEAFAGIGNGEILEVNVQAGRGI